MTEPDVSHLLRTTAASLATVLHAVLDDDRHAAREVLAGSAARRTVLAAAQEAVRTRPFVAGPHLCEKLQLVADVGRVGELVDRLARGVIDRDRRCPLTPSQRMTVAVLLDAGTRRLEQLADGPVGPALHPSYRCCGGALFEVADDGARDGSATITLCAGIAVVLLQASRHASRAA